MDPGSNLDAPALRPRIPAVAALEATRRSLLTRLKDQGDHEGWQRFFDTYGGIIHSVALKAGLSVSDADEVLQETLVSVAQQMPDFRYDPARGSFKGWLFQITRRRIADQFRRWARQRRGLEDSGADLDQVPDPAQDPLGAVWDEEWRQNQLKHAIERVKEKVSPAQWQLFDLFVLQECPTERVCSLLGVNRAQLYMVKLRVGRQLRQELSRLAADESA